MIRAYFRVKADGVDFTAATAKRLLSLSVTDAAGVDSDSIKIVVADPRAQIEPPRRGAVVSAVMGWARGTAMAMGKYTVDAVSVKGWPQTMTMTGRAADLRETLKQHRTQGWENKTLGEIVQEIAGRNQLIPAISGEIASQRIPFVAQSEEGDGHFIRRLAERYGGFAAPKEGRLIVVKRGQGKSATGRSLPFVKIGPNGLLSYSCDLADRPQFSKVIATWSDRPGAMRREVETSASEEGPEFTIREPFASEEEAKAASEAKAEGLKRAGGSLSLSLPGDPLIRAEAPLVVSGLRSGVDGKWTIQRVTHSISASGFITKIEADKGDAE